MAVRQDPAVTDTADPATTVHWCPVCGPVLELATDDPDISIVMHQNLPHPFDVTLDNERVRH